MRTKAINKYRDINEVTYKILPESEDGYYRFKQPPVDTMYVDYTVDLSQSQATNEENLEFLWLVSYSKDKKTVTDTITTRDLRLTFPPKKSSAFDISVLPDGQADECQFVQRAAHQDRLSVYQQLVGIERG